MARQLAGDFDWGIQPEDGYSVIALDDVNEESEVIFKYNYTGTLSGTKYLDVKLFQNDCSTAADASLAFINATTGGELDIDLVIIQETISNSVHYQDIIASAAIIGFCVRVDYNYIDGDGLTESPSPLTSRLTLVAISAERTSAIARPPTSSSTTLSRPSSAWMTTARSVALRKVLQLQAVSAFRRNVLVFCVVTRSTKDPMSRFFFFSPSASLVLLELSLV
jgi:hypothetical protein